MSETMGYVKAWRYGITFSYDRSFRRIHHQIRQTERESVEGPLTAIVAYEREVNCWTRSRMDSCAW